MLPDRIALPAKPLGQLRLHIAGLFVCHRVEAGIKVRSQWLLTAISPDVAVAQMATYVEYLGVGQCTFFDFDLTGTGYCDGGTYLKGGQHISVWQDGRVDLITMVLEDLYGLPPATSGLRDEPGTSGDREFRWALYQNSPNPWSVGTEIRYEAAAPGRVSIKIYSPTGQFIRTVVDKNMAPGRHAAVWDGTNTSGRPVADGIYFYKMEAPGFTATRKMLVMR
jgi:hypothetical protein